MAFIRHDRIGGTTTSTGTSDLTLSGSALTAHRTLQSVASVGDTFSYAIVAVDGTGAETGDWETGIGTYSATNVLTRTTVQASSAGGTTAVNFTAGTKRVYLTALASDINGTVRAISGAPSGISNTGLAVRTDAPYQGVLYNNGSPLQNSYTWAARPSPTSALDGVVIHISDLGGYGGSDWKCSSYDGGTNYAWMPLGKYLPAVRVHTLGSATVLDSTDINFGSYSAPAGLIVPGCTIVARHGYVCAGTFGTITPKLRVGSSSVLALGRSSTSVVNYQAQAYLFVDQTSRNTQYQMGLSQTAVAFSNSSTQAMVTQSFDLTNAWTFNWTVQGVASTTDTAQQYMRELEIYYP